MGLSPKDRALMERMFKNPLDIPHEFKWWLQGFFQVNQPRISSSNIIGARPVADTVSELGPALHGQTGLLRAGPVGYGFLSLTYDEFYGKWVSDVVSGQVHNVLATVSTTGVAYTQPVETDVARGYIPFGSHLMAAGMVPQVHAMSRMSNNGAGNVTFLRSDILEFSNEDTSYTSVASGAEISHVGTTATFKVSGWTALSVGTPNKDHAVLMCSVKVSAGTGGYEDIYIAMRWVSA